MVDERVVDEERLIARDVRPNDRPRPAEQVFTRRAEADLFEGDQGAARRWLRKPQRALGDNTPLAMSRTEVGAAEVENLIGRLEYGVFT